jgi:predicted nucleotidyltransferase
LSRLAAVNLSEEDRAKIVSWAETHPEIQRVWLYGSRARGNNQEDSDIDLAIEMDFVEWFEWYSKFEENCDLLLSHKVDLEWYAEEADLKYVGEGVRRDGVLLYE